MVKKTSSSQFETMVRYLERNPQMLSGKLDFNFSKETKERKWEELAEILNADSSGPSKSSMNWRKTWKDWKSYVKKKAVLLAEPDWVPGTGISPKREMTSVERKLIAVLDVYENGEESPPESVEEPASIFKMDPSSDTYAYCDQQLNSFYGEPPSKKTSEPHSIKIIHPQTDTKTQRTHNQIIKTEKEEMTLFEERKIKAIESKTLASERMADAAERQAEAAERLAAAQEKRALAAVKKAAILKRQNTFQLRMERAKYL